VVGQATGRQGFPDHDVHLTAVDRGQARWPDTAGAADGDRQDRCLAGDRDGEGAVLERADRAVGGGGPLRVDQQRVPGGQGPGGRLVDLAVVGGVPVTSIIPAARIAGPSSQIRNISRLARIRSPGGSTRRCTVGSRLDWWLDTTT
jgi:hypothetical protein